MIRLEYKINSDERSVDFTMNNSDDNKPSSNVLLFKKSSEEQNEEQNKEQNKEQNEEQNKEQNEEQNKEQNEEQNEEQSKEQSEETVPRKNWLIDIIKKGGLEMSILLGIIAAFFSQRKDIDKLSFQIENLSDSIVTTQDIDVLNNSIASLRDLSNNSWININGDINSIEDRISDLAVDVGILTYTNQIYLNNVESNIKQTIMPMCQNDSVTSVSDPMWEDSDILAVDSVTKEKYLASELAGDKLILSYTQNNQEVLFCGQFSSNNKWDGECVVNVYEDNKLCLITEALYDEGTLISYRQVFAFTTKAGEDVWCISKRRHIDGKNYGDSWNFYKDTDIELDFALNEATLENIYTVNKLQDSIDRTHIEALYHGYTSDGQYNDTTGEAYLIKFSKYDGTVKTLYVGNFVNGSFSDSSGNAWYIVRDDKNPYAQYMYYIGKFEAGNAIDEITSDNAKNNLGIDDIKIHTDSIFFKCELNWYGFSEL